MRIDTKNLRSAGLDIEMDGKPVKGDFVLDLWGKVEISNDAREFLRDFCTELNLTQDEYDELMGQACDMSVMRVLRAVATHPI